MDNRTAVAYLLKIGGRGGGGGNTVSGSSRDSPGTMGIRPEEGNFPDSRILARGYESRSGLTCDQASLFFFSRRDGTPDSIT